MSTSTRVNSKTGYDLNGEPIGGYILQAASELDLTDASTPSEAEIIADQILKEDDDGLSSNYGGGKVIPVKAWAVVTEELAADSTQPVVTIQDESGNSVGLTISDFADADSVDAVRFAELTSGADTTPVTVTTEALEAEVTTAAADSGTAAGKCKVFVLCLLVK